MYALGGAPSGAVQLRRQRIAVCVSDSGALGLLKRFGFAYDVVTRNDLNDATKPPLTDYDVFINTVVSMTSTGSSSLNATGKAKLTAYVAAGKDYIGIGGTGASVPGQFGLFAYTLKSYPGTLDSAIRIDYDTGDPVGSGFGAQGYGFANSTRTFFGLGAGVSIAAAVHSPDFLVSGYWPSWQSSGAAGQPIVIRWASGTQDATLIGLDPIFRGHPEDSFRLVANAIYSGLE